MGFEWRRMEDGVNLEIGDKAWVYLKRPHTKFRNVTIGEWIGSVFLIEDAMGANVVGVVTHWMKLEEPAPPSVEGEVMSEKVTEEGE